MKNYASHVSKLATPQSEAADERQVLNSAGGYTFQLDDWQALDRWLILGCEGGTYYASEKAITKANAKTVERCLGLDPVRTVNTIVAVSESGRAPKNDPAIFALALASAHPDTFTRKTALDALHRVCRTGTHLFQFVDSVQHFRGWGRALRSAIGEWYTEKDAERLAYQLVKYRQRGGWSHKDLLRLSHPTAGPETAAVLRWAITGGMMGERVVDRKAGGTTTYPAVEGELPKVIEGFERAMACTSPQEAAKLVHEYGLTHEMLPSEVLSGPAVWYALLEKMPAGAMLRNLGRMSANGLLKPLSEPALLVAERLRDAERIRKAKLHPMSVLTALRTYASGHGMRGSLSWTPVPQIVDALDDAFYSAFANIEPSNKSTLLALDVSGSMAGGSVAGSPLTPREASAAMALVTAKTEPNYACIAFSDKLSGLDISAKMRLQDAVKAVSGKPFRATDCALPMIWAHKAKIHVETFVIYTDNETWFGQVHPHQALRAYRNATGINAKLIVVGMTATNFTIADPADGGMLDVVGFDSAAPSVMADFARG